VLAVPSAPLRIAGRPSAAMKVSFGFAATWYSSTSITRPRNTPTPAASAKYEGGKKMICASSLFESSASSRGSSTAAAPASAPIANFAPGLAVVP
jgi:hypothetical protein